MGWPSPSVSPSGDIGETNSGFSRKLVGFFFSDVRVHLFKTRMHINFANSRTYQISGEPSVLFFSFLELYLCAQKFRLSATAHHRLREAWHAWLSFQRLTRLLLAPRSTTLFLGSLVCLVFLGFGRHVNSLTDRKNS